MSVWAGFVSCYCFKVFSWYSLCRHAAVLVVSHASYSTYRLTNPPHEGIVYQKNEVKMFKNDFWLYNFGLYKVWILLHAITNKGMNNNTEYMCKDPVTHQSWWCHHAEGNTGINEESEMFTLCSCFHLQPVMTINNCQNTCFALFWIRELHLRLRLLTGKSAFSCITHSFTNFLGYISALKVPML